MVSWLKTYGHAHLFYIVLIAVGVISFRVWLSEHDARVQADNTVKQQQAVVAGLQQQIVAVQAQATQKVQVVTKVVHDAVTPSQVVQSLPQVDTKIAADLSARVAPDNPVAVEVNAQPLMQLVGDLKTSQIELGACQQTVTLKDQQLQAKDVEIVALKKKPKLLKRIGHVFEAVGVGIGIGVLLVK